jgi:hypothetical protein
MPSKPHLRPSWPAQPTQQQLLENIRTKIASAIESSNRHDKDGTSFESRLLRGVMQNTCDLAKVLSMQSNHSSK